MVVQRIYISTKNGTLIFGYNFNTHKSQTEDELLASFLSAIQLFANTMKWPTGTLLVRSENIECRIRSGENIFAALFVENSRALDDMVEPLLGDMTMEICSAFEKEFGDLLKQQLASNIIDDHFFQKFTLQVQKILDDFANETNQLYQKLILIKGLYAKVPQKWLLPLMEKINQGKSIEQDLSQIMKKYRTIKKVIQEVNESHNSVWSLYNVPLFTVNN